MLFNPIGELYNLYNRLLERGWLPADYGTKPYEEMDACKQSLIDSFQPREEYDEVVANPDKYIVKNFNVEKLFGFSSAF
jgi:hypothetical protein